ncbi:MAG: hypothetical protein ACRC7S_14840 [Cetobacterium sp.]
MSNLSKKIIDVEIDNKKYIATFDMKSIEVYKEISGGSFILGYSKLIAFDDKATIDFLGATLRPEESPNEPIGIKIYDMNLIELLVVHSALVVKLVFDSLPKAKNVKKK